MAHLVSGFHSLIRGLWSETLAIGIGAAERGITLLAPFGRESSQTRAARRA